ncbi:hypothetical protein DDB_G0276059 [Dictyostelium discoideum AX4]|uniref:Transmembrane protein n=1 Tax=Dictyostelium discoideum TaxID=44689 RepID=Q75JM5_DICDI|nr:hypothetical protein DDB_G0276059 [Dictyostelium discoideum AX4]EAL69329.1 hypothetical protein DDB_G0276059 [Dictyostelium discoideum AX4]|eukprot:XP_643330.1 hypothetical protein DDB_G0276059 [Dictyostelium discoideum AX4]
MDNNNNNNNPNNNNPNNNPNNNNEIVLDINNENKYIFGLKFNYPKKENNVIVKRKSDNKDKFIWIFSNEYPINLRDYISKEDFKNDIKIVNGLNGYFIFIIGLYSFWVLFFSVMFMIGFIPKISPVLLGLFGPFLFFSILSLIYQLKFKRHKTFLNYLEGRIRHLNHKYRDIQIVWKLEKKIFINFHREKKLKVWIEIQLPNYPIKIVQSCPQFSNIQISIPNN